MDDETGKHASSADSEESEELPHLPLGEQVRPIYAPWQNILPEFRHSSYQEYFRSVSEMLKNLSAFTKAFGHSLNQIGKGSDYKNQPTLRIAILEQPLSALSLSAIITAIT